MTVIRPYRPGDEQGIVELFAIVFEQPLSLEAWRWKYQRDNDPPPAFVAEEDGQIVCHYGALRQRLVWHGEEQCGWDIVDVMCHPRFQGRGLFRRAAKAFIDELWEGRSLLMYGFPGEKHRRLGEMVLGYLTVAPVYKVRKMIPTSLPSLPGEIVVRENVSADWNEDWRKLEGRFGLVNRRDEAYLSWRYFARPEKRYRVLTVRGVPALAVVAIEGTIAYLMEFLLEPQEPAQAARLLLAAEVISKAEGAREIEGWFPELAWETKFLAGPGGFAGAEADHSLVCPRIDAGLDIPWLKNHFYYSLGDYDVF